MKAYFGSNRRNYIFKRRKRILNLTEGFYAFQKRKRILNLLERNYPFEIGKRILKVRQGLRLILRETTGALLQINLTKGYGRSWTVGLNLDGSY